MELPGRPDYEPQLATTSGADHGTAVQNVHKEILPSTGPALLFKPGVMWETLKQLDNEVDLTIQFPGPVSLTAIRIHTQHSGQYHQAQAVTIEAEQNGRYEPVATSPITRRGSAGVVSGDDRAELATDISGGRDRDGCAFGGCSIFRVSSRCSRRALPEDWANRLGIERPRAIAMSEALRFGCRLNVGQGRRQLCQCESCTFRPRLSWSASNRMWKEISTR